MKNWQAHGDLTILAGYAPQENGPSQHKEHFWDQVTKTMAKASETHIRNFWRRLQGGHPAGRRGDRVATPMRESHGQWSAHRRDLQSGAALEPVDLGCEIGAIEPLLEGNT